MSQATDLLARFSIHDIGVMVRQPIGHNTVGRHDAPRNRDGYVVDRERPRPPVRERRGSADRAGVYSRSEGRGDGRMRRVVREPGMN